jgi:hypothetical protein
MTRLISLMALTALTVLLVHAQNIAGDWQGTLKAGSQQLRIILHVAKGDGTATRHISSQVQTFCAR